MICIGAYIVFNWHITIRIFQGFVHFKLKKGCFLWAISLISLVIKEQSFVFKSCEAKQSINVHVHLRISNPNCLRFKTLDRAITFFSRSLFAGMLSFPMNSRERSIRPVCAHNVLKARGRFGYPALARQATFQVCAFVIHFSVNFFGVDWREGQQTSFSVEWQCMLHCTRRLVKCKRRYRLDTALQHV